ncbi:MAG: hypothetical protein KDH94_06245, partial [Coxiellaceae bacterium]|nr:hypothetical protein [Coxiellaceae bacterium]
MNELNLKGFSFQALFTPAGLAELDQAFLNELKAKDADAFARLVAHREAALDELATSELIIQIAPVLEAFIADLFDIEDSVAKLQAATLSDDPVFAFKKYFILRETRRNLKKE